MPKQYRTNGAIGALLDEYEKAIEELKTVISDVSVAELSEVVDSQTTDEDCRSIQTILSHVVSSGYNYAIAIRRSLGESLAYKSKETCPSAAAYQQALDQMFVYNVLLFEDFPAIQLDEYEPAKKIQARWGQQYDVEQLLEHAIVHVLRHRRQIERFLLVLRGKQ